jgi:allantoin racemase
MKALQVINPNSSKTVTEGIRQALEPLAGCGVPIVCHTLAEGPRGIESQADADRVIPPLLTLAERLEPEAAGYVIACFGDPGLHALRHETALPVVGIQEAAVMQALTLGQRFGVLAILGASVPRHLRAFGAMGVLGRLAGDLPLNLQVHELADQARTLARMVEVGTDLRDRHGADVLILGCAGMAQLRLPLSRALKMPVVDPCQAAAALAISHILLQQSHRITDAE